MSKNKQNRQTAFIALLVILITVSFVRHFHIKNFCTVIPAKLYTSGQPRRMDYTRLLYKHHIATIVNIRQSAEHREEHWYNEEIIWVRQNGVNYIELPIPKRPDYFPDKSAQTQFLRLMSNKANLPVLLHGASGRKRVSMLTAVWLIKSEGYDVGEAIKVIEAIKKSPVTEEEKKFIKTLSKSL